MQITGLRYGSKLLDLVEFPVSHTLSGGATKEEIQELLDKSGKVVVKPFFYGGVGKKGKSGLIRIVDNVHDAMIAKEELYFAENSWGGKTVHANGVTFEEYVESDIELKIEVVSESWFGQEENLENNELEITIYPQKTPSQEKDAVMDYRIYIGIIILIIIILVILLLIILTRKKVYKKNTPKIIYRCPRCLNKLPAGAKSCLNCGVIFQQEKANKTFIPQKKRPPIRRNSHFTFNS